MKLISRTKIAQIDRFYQWNFEGSKLEFPEKAKKSRYLKIDNKLQYETNLNFEKDIPIYKFITNNDNHVSGRQGPNSLNNNPSANNPSANIIEDVLVQIENENNQRNHLIISTTTINCRFN